MQRNLLALINALRNKVMSNVYLDPLHRLNAKCKVRFVNLNVSINEEA